MGLQNFKLSYKSGQMHDVKQQINAYSYFIDK